MSPKGYLCINLHLFFSGLEIKPRTLHMPRSALPQSYIPSSNLLLVQEVLVPSSYHNRDSKMRKGAPSLHTTFHGDLSSP